MAAFPTLTPSASQVTPGAWPVATISSLSGTESCIRQGSAQIGRRLQLTFTNVTEANFLAILNHYRGQRSGFDSFGFDTATLAADLTPAGYAWLYASRPQVVDEHADVFTVTCEFKAEPRGLVVAMGKAWRTLATTLTPGARDGGIIYGKPAAWVTPTTTMRPQIRALLAGVQAPLLGAGPATDYTGWSRVVNASEDDASILFGSWPFTFYLAGTGYTACYPTSNGLATFGSGSASATSSASSPQLPKLMFGPGDRSWQRLYTQTGNGYARFRWEGHNTWFEPPAPGSSTRIAEITFWQSDGVFQLIEVRTGNFAAPTAGQPSRSVLVASASTAYASADTLDANQSWVFRGNEDGTSWTLLADSYVLG